MPAELALLRGRRVGAGGQGRAAELPPGPQGKPPSAPSSGSPLLFREVANLGNVRRPEELAQGAGSWSQPGNSSPWAWWKALIHPGQGWLGTSSPGVGLVPLEGMLAEIRSGGLGFI